MRLIRGSLRSQPLGFGAMDLNPIRKTAIRHFTAAEQRLAESDHAAAAFAACCAIEEASKCGGFFEPKYLKGRAGKIAAYRPLTRIILASYDGLPSAGSRRSCPAIP